MRRVRREVRSRVVRSVITGAVLALAMTAQACSPASASAVLTSRFFGMHVPSLDTSFPSSLHHEVGSVNLTGNGVYWPSLEPARGVWEWARLDSVVGRARAQGAQPLLVLGQTPSWTGARATAAPPMAAWEDYVRAVVARYGTRLDYEIWPEPNIIQNWSGTPQQLAVRVVAAARIIHRAAPKAVVVAPALVLRLRYQQVFMDKFFASRVDGRRVGGFVDAVGLDLYPQVTGTPEDSMVLLRRARAILRSHGVNAPIWNVEISYGVVGAHQPSPLLSPATQAAYVARTYVLNAAANVKRVYWFGWGHWAEVGVALARDDGSPTVAGDAFRTVVAWLRGAKVGTCSQTTKQHLYTCALRKAGQTSRVYWTTKGRTVVRAPKGSRHVQSVTGSRKGTRAGGRLTVTSSPIWVYH